jgi:hypothetical protein
VAPQRGELLKNEHDADDGGDDQCEADATSAQRLRPTLIGCRRPQSIKG